MAVVSVAGPAMKPLYQTRATARRAARRRAASCRSRWTCAWQTVRRDADRRSLAPARRRRGVDAPRRSRGLVGLSCRRLRPSTPAAAATRRRRSRAVRGRRLRRRRRPVSVPLPARIASQAFLDGSLAHLPWLQEMPDPMTSAMWSSWVEINPKTAERLGIAHGDVVEVTSAHGIAAARRRSSRPASRPTSSRCRSGRGTTNVHALRERPRQNPVEHSRAGRLDAETGALAWAATRVKVTRVGDPDGKLIMFAGARSEADAARTRSKGRRDNGPSMGHGGRSGPLHGLRGVRDRVPRREQHPDRRRPARRRAAARCTGFASSATGKASSPTSG